MAGLKPEGVRQEKVGWPEFDGSFNHTLETALHALSTRTAVQRQATKWVIQEILAVDVLEVTPDPTSDSHTYVCWKGYREVCRMNIPDDVPLQDKVTALKLAIRLAHGNDR